MKPSKDQLIQLEVDCADGHWKRGDHEHTTVRIEDLRALLDDYRARGEVLRGIVAAPNYNDDWVACAEVLEGSGDEP